MDPQFNRFAELMNTSSSMPTLENNSLPEPLNSETKNGPRSLVSWDGPFKVFSLLLLTDLTSTESTDRNRNKFSLLVTTGDSSTSLETRIKRVPSAKAIEDTPLMSFVSLLMPRISTSTLSEGMTEP